MIMKDFIKRRLETWFNIEPRVIAVRMDDVNPVKDKIIDEGIAQYNIAKTHRNLIYDVDSDNIEDDIGDDIGAT